MALERTGPFDGVVHLAGAGIGDRRWTAGRKAEILESRVRSTGLLVRSLLDLPSRPEVLVGASAVGFYGDRGDEALTEDAPRGRGFLADVCAAWEGAAAPGRDAGIRTVHLRSGIVLCAQGGALARQLTLFRLGLGGPLGSGRQYRSWITLDDEVAVILRCLEDRSLAGPVNAASPSPVTDRAFARALGSALHRPAVARVPASALRLALGGEMADELILTSQRVIPAALSSAGFAFRHPELPAALDAVLAMPA